MMGVQLMHEAWRAGVDKFVAIGTVCAYPKFTPVPFHEDDLWNGYPEETNAPYGLAKKMMLVQAQTYRQQYGFNCHLPAAGQPVRPARQLRPGDIPRHPGLIRKCVEARVEGDDEIVAWGDGSPTREFLYVEDAAEGIVLGAERYDGDLPVNLGSGREISIHDLVSLIARLTGFEGQIRWDTTRPNGQPRRALDTSRAEALFGFRAATGFEEGLMKTVAWYQENRQAILARG